MNVLQNAISQVVPEIIIVDNVIPITQTKPNTKKCSLCKKSDHIISQCSNEEFADLKKQDELIFERLMFQRLNTDLVVNANYLKFVAEIQNTNKNVLKYFVSKNGGLVSRRNKQRLVGMYLYQLIDNYLTTHENEFENYSEMFVKHLMIIIAERSYWLYIGAGHTEEEAMQIYNERLAELNAADTDSKNANTYPIEVYIDAYTIYNKSGHFECNICYESCSENSKVGLICNHDFCVSCVESTLKMCNETKQYPTCAMCRTDYISLITRTDEVFDVLKPFCDY